MRRSFLVSCLFLGLSFSLYLALCYYYILGSIIGIMTLLMHHHRNKYHHCGWVYKAYYLVISLEFDRINLLIVHTCSQLGVECHVMW